jgi:hypothetical protein
MLEWCQHYYHTYTAEDITNGMEWRKRSFLNSAYREYYQHNISTAETVYDKFEEASEYQDNVLSRKSYEEVAEMWEAVLATGHRRRHGI